MARGEWEYSGLEIEHCLTSMDGKRKYRVSAEERKAYGWVMEYYPSIEFGTASEAARNAEAFERDFTEFLKWESRNQEALGYLDGMLFTASVGIDIDWLLKGLGTLRKILRGEAE